LLPWPEPPFVIMYRLFALGNWLVHFELSGIAETAELGIRLSTFVLAILVPVTAGGLVRVAG